MYWITGAKGLLGSALCAQCKAALHSGHEVDIADFISIQTFVKKHPEITYIINAAAFSQVDAAEEFRAEAYRANVIGPENLARIANDIGAKLIHISTDYVFPGNVKRPLTENDPVGPLNYYGKTKLQGEQRVLGTSLVIRTSWIFGQGGKNFVAKLLHMLMTQPEIHLTNDQWGRPTYAPDLAAAIFQMRDQTGLYQYANSGVVTKYEFGLAMLEEARSLGLPVVTKSIVPVPGSFFPSPCKRPVYSAFDTTKIEQHIPIRPWREGLRELLCARQPASL
ncbi:MAG TPA: dTDP-4-dehydrorhamnose reductase [Chlamydiales bacterium]|nr:dTDP-4-dehydrorhamnose reductase [Chlamydiales bacterium]